MRELERLLGRNTVEVEILKEALDVARAENRAERLEVPIDSRAILNRMQEISFNSSLMGEMRAITFVTKLIDDGKLAGAKEYTSI